MGWIYCPNCKSKITSKAVRCYYCGYQIKEDPYQARRTYFNRFFYVRFIFGIIVIIAFIPILLQSHFHGILSVIILIIALLIMVWGYKLNNKQTFPWSRRISSKHKKRLPTEETYYYKGKTNQQLHQYNEALQCYNHALELNPDFEPAKEAKQEVENSLNK